MYKITKPSVDLSGSSLITTPMRLMKFINIKIDDQPNQSECEPITFLGV